MKQTIKANILIQQELIIKAFSIKWKFNNVKYNGKEKKINTITKHNIANEMDYVGQVGVY